MADKPTVQLVMEYDAQEFWSAIFGGAWETHEWWRKVRYLGDADWNTIGRVQLSIDNPDDYSKALTKTIGIEDLAKAWSKAITDRNCDACTGRPLNVENVDSCVSDLILQIAVMGQAHYS